MMGSLLESLDETEKKSGAAIQLAVPRRLQRCYFVMSD
jgi:hypothetical protein